MTNLEKKQRRVVVVVLDSAGIGELPDAASYGDVGAATLQHTAQAVGGLTVPHLEALGLGNIAPIAGVAAVPAPQGYVGKMAEVSLGKDTTTGHWELMGLIIKNAFRTFPFGFPAELIEKFVAATGHGVLGNKTASGTAIIDELGAEHLATGKWILYTSADSVFQLAAHEEKIPLAELYKACETARELANPWRIGRVIARPFVGKPGSFFRTPHRHDYSMLPTGPTVLTALESAGIPVVGIGKIHDIYAGVGVSRSYSMRDNADGLARSLALVSELKYGLLMVNLVDFDMQFGHRRDASGYARALQEFDQALPRIMAALEQEDLLVLTADHGCDPTFTAHTDHTREYVPLVVWSPSLRTGGSLGIRACFADVGATVAAAFGVDWHGAGKSFLPELAGMGETR
jgi:phosphopentomutase